MCYVTYSGVDALFQSQLCRQMPIHGMIIETRQQQWKTLFNLIVYFFFLDPSESVFVLKKDPFSLPMCRTFVGLFIQRFSIHSFFLPTFFWCYSWIIYWIGRSLFKCTPHIHFAPFLILFSFFSFVRKKSQVREKRGGEM